MKSDQIEKSDFREPTSGRRAPRAVADAIGGIIFAVADVAAAPGRVYRALTTHEIEKWWAWAGVYHQKDWKADLRVQGRWSVTVAFLKDGSLNRAWGEFCELDFPNKIVMTRRFEQHPFQGDRETTITYRFEPISEGTRVTVRDEGFIGRPQAAYGNAEVWERVLSWLDAYLAAEPLGSG